MYICYGNYINGDDDSDDNDDIDVTVMLMLMMTRKRRRKQNTRTPIYLPFSMFKMRPSTAPLVGGGVRSIFIPASLLSSGSLIFVW